MSIRSVPIVIVGAGFAGIALAARLRNHGRARRYQFLIVDAQPPLAAWKQATRAQGMMQLRTPATQHLGTGSEELLDLVHEREHGRGCTCGFTQTEEARTQPVQLAHFNEHADGVITRTNLMRDFLQGWVLSIEPVENGGYFIEVMTSKGLERLLARTVVVGVGMGKPTMPGQGPESPRLVHASSVDVSGPLPKQVCIVGGGLTAATLAVELADRGVEVMMCTRSSVTVSQLEADPGWLPGGALFKEFHRFDPAQRSRVLRAARVGRGITPAIHQRLTTAVQTGRIDLFEGAPMETWFVDQDGRLALPQLGRAVDQVICATGFRQDVRDIRFLAPLIGQMDVYGGVPMLDENFMVPRAPRLHMIGRLAEMQSGALARNLPGIRYAADTIAQSIN